MVEGARKKRARDVPAAGGKSWLPGQKGQGAEGLSKGYGGSGGDGTGASGPDTGASRRRGERKSPLSRTETGRK